MSNLASNRGTLAAKMKKIAVVALAVLTTAAVAAPAADASTASQLRSLNKAVKQLKAQNTTLTRRMNTLQTQNTALAGRVTRVEGRANANDATDRQLATSAIFLLGVSLCEPNAVTVDFNFIDGVHTEEWFTGDAFGPNPVGGFSFCVNDAIAQAQALRAPAKARVVAPTLVPMLDRALAARNRSVGK